MSAQNTPYLWIGHLELFGKGRKGDTKVAGGKAQL